MNSVHEPAAEPAANTSGPVRAVLSHFGICVSDLDVSRGFYTQVFGFEETYGRKVDDEFARLLQLPTVDSYICILSLGERRLELIHHYSPPAAVEPLRPINTVGLTHMAIYVPDLVEAGKLVEQHSGTSLWDSHTRIPVGGEDREYMTVLDPDEVRIELIRGLPLG